MGLAYTAQYKSVKLAGTADELIERKRVTDIGVVLINTHYQGLKYGPDFSTLDDMPLQEDGADTAADTIWTEYNQLPMEFNGDYDVDSRLCLQSAAPRPCTVMAVIVGTDK